MYKDLVEKAEVYRCLFACALLEISAEYVHFPVCPSRILTRSVKRYLLMGFLITVEKMLLEAEVAANGEFYFI